MILTCQEQNGGNVPSLACSTPQVVNGFGTALGCHRMLRQQVAMHVAEDVARASANFTVPSVVATSQASWSLLYVMWFPVCVYLWRLTGSGKTAIC